MSGRCSLLLAGVAVALVAGACKTTPVTPQTARDRAGGGGGGSRAAARDSALEQRVARLELRLVERDAQLEDSQAGLDEARQEVVGTLGQLQSNAARAA